AVKMGKQYALTEKKGVPFGILIGKDDEKNGTLTLKNLKTREQQAGLSVMQAASIILKKN
ncbi:MAG: histidine--tRNA ligase, partial [Treponema sp.]|nr:histidine--tRNA ligase [Treponema sp.]